MKSSWLTQSLFDKNAIQMSWPVQLQDRCLSQISLNLCKEHSWTNVNTAPHSCGYMSIQPAFVTTCLAYSEKGENVTVFWKEWFQSHCLSYLIATTQSCPQFQAFFPTKNTFPHPDSQFLWHGFSPPRPPSSSPARLQTQLMCSSFMVCDPLWRKLFKFTSVKLKNWHYAPDCKSYSQVWLQKSAMVSTSATSLPWDTYSTRSYSHLPHGSQGCGYKHDSKSM